MLKSINPFNNSIIAEYDEYSPEKVNEIIKKTQADFLLWKEKSFDYRKKRMENAAKILRDNKEKYAMLITEEMGKPITQSRAEIGKCAWVCEYYAEGAEEYLQDEIVKTEAYKSYATYQPIGIVLAVMPWNYPFWQVFRFAAPNLMAGNAGLLKHSSNVTGCSYAIEEIFKLAGFPENLFRSLIIKSDKVEAVINNPAVKAVTLTGSALAGKSVAALAGAALKKSVLELGGSDPYIILGDADLNLTIKACYAARFLNGGQSCIAAKRFIVVESIYDEFVKRFIDEIKTKKSGDPKDEKTDIGPQARADLRDELHEQVMKSVSLGANVLLGGKIPEGDNAYYPPTILADVKKGMPAYEEELFGPVAAIIKVKDEAEAVQVANDTIFGLGSAIFTSNITKGERIAKYEIEAGSCFVNDFVKSDPHLPFGGIKSSGYGRELAPFGIKEFVNIKTVVVKK